MKTKEKEITGGKDVEKVEKVEEIIEKSPRGS